MRCLSRRDAISEETGAEAFVTTVAKAHVLAFIKGNIKRKCFAIPEDDYDVRTRHSELVEMIHISVPFRLQAGWTWNYNFSIKNRRSYKMKSYNEYNCPYLKIIYITSVASRSEWERKPHLRVTRGGAFLLSGL